MATAGLFHTLLFHGLCKANIVRVLSVQNILLCDSVSVYMHRHPLRHTAAVTSVSRHDTAGYPTLMVPLWSQRHQNRDPYPKKHLSSTTATRHQSTTQPRASLPTEGKEEPAQELCWVLGTRQVCASSLTANSANKINFEQ